MIFTAHADGRLELDGRVVRCALGKGGVLPADEKREGDGASPLGTWTIRKVLYRPDVYPHGPRTALPVEPIAQMDGWCDAPADPLYNQLVALPYPASAERMWRDDHVYDLVGVLAHNDDPVIPGLGSAIFLHLARENYEPTEGCVALARADLEGLLHLATPGSAVAIVGD